MRVLDAVAAARVLRLVLWFLAELCRAMPSSLAIGYTMLNHFEAGNETLLLDPKTGSPQSTFRLASARRPLFISGIWSLGRNTRWPPKGPRFGVVSGYP